MPEGVAFGAYTLVKPDVELLPYHLYIGIKCRDMGERKNTELIKKHKESKYGKI